MSSVVAVVCLAVLTLLSVVRAIYRISAWYDAPPQALTEEMFAAAVAMLMGILSIAALVAAAQPLTH